MYRVWVVLFIALLNSVFAVAQDDFAPIYIADGFDAPLGTATERHSEATWSTHWRSHWAFGLPENPGGILQYDSGMILYGNNPRASTVYAAASGIVVITQPDTRWQGVIIIHHDPLYHNDGERYYTRYRYLQSINVNIGDRIERGQSIATIDGTLGFDVSPTSILTENPLHYPADNPVELSHYVNPREFISSHRPRQPERTSRFAPPTTGIPSQGFSGEHPGIDLDTPIGEPVFAATEGAVIWIGDCANCQFISQRVYPCNANYQQDADWGYGYGSFVVVRYAAVLMPQPVRDLIARYTVEQDYVYVLYAHLSQVDVRYGDAVTADTLLGLTGETGCTSAPGLHVEVRLGDEEAIHGSWLEQDAINPHLMFDF